MKNSLAGLPADDLREQPKICPQCGMSGGNGWVNTTSGATIPCPACNGPHQRPRLLATRTAWPLPIRMQTWDWAGLEQRRGADDSFVGDARTWLDVVREDREGIVSSGNGGLYLYGRFGRGKTGAAAAMYHELSMDPEQPWALAWCSVVELIETMKTGFHDGDEGAEARRRVNLAREADFLVLDDLGAERPSSYALEQLLRLIEHRRDAGLVTVITSNFSLADLDHVWSEAGGTAQDDAQLGRVLNRLGEYCCQLWHVQGASLRPSWKRESDR